MHSSRMRTVRSSSRLSRGGVCLSAWWDTPWEQTPPGADTAPWEQTPPAADTPQEQTPPLWDQAPPPLCGQTDACQKHNLRNFVADGNK